MYFFSTASLGRSLRLYILPRCPMPLRSSSANIWSGSGISDDFQKPNEQCCLNAAILHSIAPLYIKCGKLHFHPSSTSGQAWCTSSRRWFNTGFAKSAALSIYASILGLRLVIPGYVWLRNISKKSQPTHHRQVLWGACIWLLPVPSLFHLLLPLLPSLQRSSGYRHLHFARRRL